MSFRIALVFLVIVTFVNCDKKKEMESPQSEAVPTSSTARSSDLDTNDGKSNAKDDKGVEKSQPKEADKSLEKTFFPVNAIKERYLEYSINLSYECNDIIQTRKELLSLISKFGFMEYSKSNVTTNQFMTLRVVVRTPQVYDALIEFDKLGKLTSENISSVDHTENLVWQNRKSAREKKRISRKNLASHQITSESKNWEAIDRSLTQSENEEDRAEHEIWKIHDKILWTKISLSLKTPEPIDTVKIPKYKKAFVGIFNLFLELSYYLIWILPFVILFGAVVFLGKILYKRFFLNK